MTRVFSFLALLACIEAHGAEPLPMLGAEASNVTVSGLSSGGFMAVQFHVAHSAIVKGAGYADAVHVGGGVVAWVNQVDPSQPAY